MDLPVVEVYSSLECPYAYLAVYRLRQVWPLVAGKVQLVWRALSLEYINQTANPKPAHENEMALLVQRVEPGLPFRRWGRPDWEWPGTLWPAFEALACAQAQGAEAAFAMSWALRYGLFAENRNIALRHELFAISQQVAAEAALDVARLEADWDSGRYKGSVIAESRRGWHTLGVNGSATFVFPDGQQVTNPAVGEIDFDEQNNLLRSYTHFAGDPLQAYRALLLGAASQP